MVRPTQAKYIFFTSGVGCHDEKIGSFEMALREAQIHPYNLVSISSIMPPNVEIVTVDHGTFLLHEGDIVYAVLSRNQTNEEHRWISSAVGWAKPLDEDKYGYISETHLEGYSASETADWCEDLAAELLASCYGIEIKDDEWDRIYNQQTGHYTIGNRPVETDSVVAIAEGTRGKWTTTVAAAVFVVGEE